ncbi:hypothetical protein MRB53_028720 [Persea americana]|uniref:Uncharacterized protein n=1 Tax=Persea americana TaxID=3435 RepID=A0ACC2KGH4_PERAE|nr:hypothetical protein MRB53_028720 [Persea americana]
MAVEAVVGFLLTKLDSFIRKNVSLLTGVETEVGEMQFKLLSIKTFLASAPDSSIEEVVVDDQLQLWIKNVREVAYDIEDVLDEFTLKLKNDSRKAPKIAKRLEVGKKLKEIKRRLHNINELKDSYFNNQWSIPGNDGWQDPRDDFHPEKRSDYGRVISYKVHPLMREFILLKSKEVNFCNKIVSNTQKLRRLSIDEGMIKDDLHASTLSHVRSFFAFGDAKSSISGILLNFKFLKVLDLESAPLESFPESLTELFFLRYLSLENTKMKKLPKSLGKLVNLEALNLKGTFVRDLPPTIVKLQNMRHLLVYHYDMKAPPFFYVKAVKLPAGIDCLKSLQKLSYIKADSKRGTISELGKLTQLRRLGVVGVRKKDCRNLCASVANMKNLLSFSVRSAVADELVDLEHLETPPPGLQDLSGSVTIEGGMAMERFGLRLGPLAIHVIMPQMLPIWI